tara:strand:- start:3490 stop:3843 length:354 start_codon:yes stop_codon:yes gene_type:complete
MRLASKEKYSSPCSKAFLVAEFNAHAKKIGVRSTAESFTRQELLRWAEEMGFLAYLEERAEIIKVLDGANISFDVSQPTYELVRLAVGCAIERYGVADLESLGRNLKFSRIAKLRDS